MLFTITLNPSIDYVVYDETFEVGTLNRATRTYKFAGGKGINVSRILSTLGMTSTTLGYIGGFPGEFVRTEMIKLGINTDFITADGDTRINIKLKSKEETEINAPGPDITQEQQQELLQRIDLMKKDDMVVISGSIPQTLEPDIYEAIARRCNEKGIAFVVDAEKDLLLPVLQYGPEFIKPNKDELEEIFGKLDSDRKLKEAAQKLIAQGAKRVMVSLGGDGAILATENIVYKATVPSGKVVNTVGAGDSTVAGMIFGMQTRSLQESFKLAVACGTATAFTEDLATKAQIDKVLPDIEIEII